MSAKRACSELTKLNIEISSECESAWCELCTIIMVFHRNNENEVFCDKCGDYYCREHKEDHDCE